MMRLVGETIATDAAFDDFYRREYRLVVGLGYALCGDRGSAEDLAQDAFLAARREWERLATYERPDAWVRRVVANRAVSLRRHRSAEQRALARWVTTRARRDPPIVDSERAVLSADSERFWAAVRALPTRQAQVVALHYIEDRPVAEIASILDVAVGTVKTHLHAARAALARALDCEDPS